MPDDLRYSRRNRIDLATNDRRVAEFAAEMVAEHRKNRKKEYSEHERAEYQRHFELILLDLLAACTTDPALYVGYSRRMEAFLRNGSYWDEEAQQPAISRTYYLAAIGFLNSKGWIENVTAQAGYGGFSSRMRAAEQLRRRFAEARLTWASVSADLTRPAIVMKDDDKRPISLPAPGPFDLEAARQNLFRINRNLDATFINIDISDEQHDALRHRAVGQQIEEDVTGEVREPIDFATRTLRRVFARGSFEMGGRFYGGWWQGVPSDLRKHIEIDGAVTVEMDYSSMQPRIFYAQAGNLPPADAYTLPGWDGALRPLIKKLFNQLINSDATSRNPRQWHRFAPAIEINAEGVGKHQLAKMQRETFRKQTGRDYSELIADLLAFHRPIDNAFFSKAWGRMQRADSDIAERVMLTLLDADIPIIALPIHDSFIVRRGAENILKRAMLDAFREVVGVNANVDREKAVWDGPLPVEGLVLGEDIHKHALDHHMTHTRYHQRERDWNDARGMID
jgi:hypothetical protein